MPRLVGDDRERRPVRYRDDLEARREFGDLVAVAHPYLMPLAHRPQAVEQQAFLGHRQEGAAELARIPRLDRATELVAHHLLAVTDAEDRHAGIEHYLRRTRRSFLGHPGGRSRQDDALGLQPLEGGFSALERGDLAIDPGLAHAARDQLGHLAAEIDDEDGLVGKAGRHGWPIRSQRARRNRSKQPPLRPNESARPSRDARFLRSNGP